MKNKKKYKEIEMDIPDDLFLEIAKQAHEQDITFNKMVELIIKTELSKLG